MRISIAMATFNGEEYLLEQLESLANQDFLPYELVVCDDRSTDQTIDIIKKFARIAPFPVKVHENSERLGYGDNFLRAVRLCRGDWIAFSDQDDVWLPHKLDDVRRAIEVDDRASLVLQNAIRCNGDLTVRSRAYPNSIRSGYHAPQSQYGFWVWLGFLQTFRASLISEFINLPRPRNPNMTPEFISHDKLTCLMANTSGGILVLPKPAALYRRHSSALTGPHEKASWREQLAIAASVGPEIYAFAADVSAETADYLRDLGKVLDPVRKTQFKNAASKFDRIAEILSARACLFSSDKLSEKLVRLWSIALRGGYFGPRMVALGPRSAVKDVLVVLGLFGPKN
ncbi:MAG: glycosyltransferase [Erythrobacter sp.]